MSIPRFSREVCPVVPAPGWWIPASSIPPASPATLDNSYEAVKALGILPAGPDSDIPIVQHAMPCICPQCPPGTGPVQLQLPMKGTFSPLSPLKSHGVRSGRRSTIIGASRSKGPVDWVIAYDLDGSPIYPNPDNPDFFLRLKGNGMWIPAQPFEFPGITLASLPSFRHERDDTLEVRGTAFPKTATYDILNNPQINAMLGKLGLHGNNIPLGLWWYGPMDGDPAPNIPKVCNVLKTESDRRLESNVFAGLDKMVLGLPTDIASEIWRMIAQVYHDQGITPPSNENRTYTRARRLAAFPANDMIAKVMGTIDPGEVATLQPSVLTTAGFLPSETVYEVIPEEVTVGNGRLLRTLAKLFGRLGWEAGRCIAAVHRCGYNWGTYQDHSSDGILDNAHANNICLLPRTLMDLGEGKYQLLFPTDFDMSFKRDQAVNTWVSPPCPAPVYVDEFFSVELLNMMGNIAGYTAALQDVQTGISKRDPEGPSAQMDVIWVLRDIASWEYLRGYQRPADPECKGNGITLDEALLFLPEALESTMDIVV